MLNNENNNLEWACLFFVNQHIVLRVLQMNRWLFTYHPSVISFSQDISHICLAFFYTRKDVTVKHRVSDMSKYKNTFQYIKNTYISVVYYLR